MNRCDIGLHGNMVTSMLVVAGLAFFIGLISFLALGSAYMLKKNDPDHMVDGKSQGGGK